MFLVLHLRLQNEGEPIDQPKNEDCLVECVWQTGLNQDAGPLLEPKWERPRPLYHEPLLIPPEEATPRENTIFPNLR